MLDAHAFAQIMQDIAGEDLDAMPCDAMVEWLAETIQRRAEIDKVLVRAVEIIPGATKPAGDARLFGGTKQVLDNDEAPKVQDVTFFGQPLVLGDQRAYSHKLIRGPQSGDLLSIAKEQVCLIIRVRTNRDVAWVLLRHDESIASPERLVCWEQCLPAILAIALKRLRPFEDRSVRGLRHRFYQRLLRHDPRVTRPTDDFRHVCETWLRVSGADWVWLWLYNSNFDQVVLTAADAANEASVSTSDITRLQPEERIAPGENSVAMYCARKKTAVHVRDAPTWQKTLDGVKYQVESRCLLERLGGTCFDCVPLFTTDGKDGETLSIAGVVTLHYGAQSNRVPHHPAALVQMGRVTALSILKSQEAEKRAILVELNSMSQRHLSRPSRRPADVRTEYLKELSELLQNRLRVNAVSVFWRSQFGDCVECVFSTGLEDTQGVRLQPDELSDVTYQPGEGYTGTSFAEGREILAPSRGLTDNHQARVREVRKISGRGEEFPFVIMPIRPPGDPKPRRALGVIRCIEQHSPVDPLSLRNFDATELQTIRFIAAQVGPVLQVFEQRIDRERVVNVVKHDLFAPLAMIRDTAEFIRRAWDAGRQVRDYDVHDIGLSSVFAMNLVDQLDPQPQGTYVASEMRLSRTLLEGDIVARVKAMLQHYARHAKRMKIHFDGFQSIPALRVDREAVERVIFNLLINAIKYGHAETTIEVTAFVGDDGYCVSVSNYGIGIEANEEPNLFKPYYRATRAQVVSSQGVGLGLTIANQIMEAHGGELRLAQRDNPTIFVVVFPRPK